ncbi:FkbM family methyltransferase [Mariprofundus sp. KV]|uniref:FkbM family methyltransferase n=1 Tax=Mariprofundus sp. KV TaxID=2608715 RepID=UPI0015A41919
MLKFLNKLRGNYLFSLVSSTLLLPVQWLCSTLDRQIRMKVWVNGRKVVYDNVPLKFPQDVGLYISSGVYWNGVQGFEPHTWKTMRHFLERVDAFVDVGSNIGFYSVLASKVNSGLSIDAFEPIPQIYSKNHEFMKENHSSYELHHAALSDKNGEFEIFLPVRSSGIEEEATATLREDSWQQRSASKISMTVKTVTLDEFGLSKYTKGDRVLIKVDVEDFEASVFSGGRAFMRQLRPIVICEMLRREHGNQETVNIIEELDYAIYAVTPAGLFRFSRDDFFKPRPFTDFLFVPKEQLKGIPNFLSYASLQNDVQFVSLTKVDG